MSKQSPTETSSTVASPLTRRNLVAGAGAVGAAAAGAALLPVQPTVVPAATASAVGDKSAEGYRLSEHVQRYYETARV
ncbi:MAG TPA: formate dehydrogenase [Rubrivivax sp.]|nr:formate dehydrogenase [Rubrivivax sp.]